MKPGLAIMKKKVPIEGFSYVVMYTRAGVGEYSFYTLFPLNKNYKENK